MSEHGGVIKSRKDFNNDSKGQAEYWEAEISSSEKRLRDFCAEGTKIDEKYKGGKRKGPADMVGKRSNFRLNLFHSNTITLMSMLYGNLPKIEVSRRYSDPNDDVGRVAAHIMERLLNNDVQDNSETYNSVLKAVLQDRLLPGLGVGRVRYEFDEGTDEESAPLEYFHWRDVCWGWARTWADIPWIAYRSYLNKDECTERFGAEVAEKLQYSTQMSTEKEELSGEEHKSAWQTAAIWEIWDKTTKKVCWWSPGYEYILESSKDFLKVRDFYPSPRFMVANQTTSVYIPTSDYHLAQDLYNELDVLQTRISIITQAVKVVGVYNQGAAELQRVFNEGTDNDLIPVDNWALFAEKGGIKGQIDWVPIKDVVEALGRLREVRDETIKLLQQVTGMSDIMRGELGGQYEGVGQSRMKVEWGSVRIQALQDEFATFASNLCQLKAEIIGIHYSAEKIAHLAHVESFQEADQEFVPAAIELLKQPRQARLQIVIRPESMAMVDYAQMKQERTEYLRALGDFLASATPLMEAEPGTTPFVLQLMQWGLAGFKGSKEIEGVVDRAIQTVTEALQEQDPNANPEADRQEQADALSHQNALELEEIKHQNAMEQITSKANADNQERQAELVADLRVIQEELNATLREIREKLAADLQKEAVSSQINVEQDQAGAVAEVEKDVAAAALEIEVDRQTADTGEAE